MFKIQTISVMHFKAGVLSLLKAMKLRAGGQLIVGVRDHIILSPKSIIHPCHQVDSKLTQSHSFETDAREREG